MLTIAKQALQEILRGDYQASSLDIFFNYFVSPSFKPLDQVSVLIKGESINLAMFLAQHKAQGFIEAYLRILQQLVSRASDLLVVMPFADLNTDLSMEASDYAGVLEDVRAFLISEPHARTLIDWVESSDSAYAKKTLVAIQAALNFGYEMACSSMMATGSVSTPTSPQSQHLVKELELLMNSTAKQL